MCWLVIVDKKLCGYMMEVFIYWVFEVVDSMDFMVECFVLVFEGVVDVFEEYIDGMFV